MKNLIVILFFALVGTVAQAAPRETVAEFASDLCSYAQDDIACRKIVESDPEMATINHYTAAVRVCHNHTFMGNSFKTGQCYGEAATAMRDFKFKQQVTDCVHKEKFWVFEPGQKVNPTWDKKVECQRNVFVQRSGQTLTAPASASNRGLPPNSIAN